MGESRAHSRFAPSAAKRWLNCPGSVPLIARIGAPDTASVYAAEGTMAHQLLEWVMTGTIPAHRLQEWVGHAQTIDGHRITVDADMVEHVRGAAETIAAIEAERPGGERLVEVTLAMTSVHPDLYGHADVIVNHPERLTVIDFKYGQGVQVEIDDNPQLMTYAVGALDHTRFRGEEIEIVIIQPRSREDDHEPVRRAVYRWVDVIDHALALARAAKEAEGPNPSLAVGDWCRWCPASYGCPAYAKHCFEPTGLVIDDPEDLATVPYEPPAMTDAQLADAMARASAIDQWIKAVQAETMRRIEAGAHVPGWKRVEKRASRKWRMEDDDVLASLVRLTNRPAEDFQDTSVKSVAQVEKVLGKKRSEILDDLYEKVSSGYTLAPEGDHRPDVVDDARAYFAAAGELVSPQS